LQAKAIWRLGAAVALLAGVVGCGSDPPPAPPAEPSPPSAICWQNETPVPRTTNGQGCDPKRLGLEAVCKDEAAWVFAFRNPTGYWVEAWLKVASTGELLDIGGVEAGTSTYSFDQPLTAPFTLTLVLVRHKGEAVELAEELDSAASSDVACPADQGQLVSCTTPRLTSETVRVTFKLDKGEIFSSVISVFNSDQSEVVSLDRTADGSYVGTGMAFAPTNYADLVYTPGSRVLQPIQVVGAVCS
jgi:hypothetical protein